jgi:hypothetical protein
VSYDYWMQRGPDDTDAAYREPYFNDTHPALGSDGIAGVAVVTDQGYARCGNYTSNVSGMWRKCLSAVTGDDTGLADLAGRKGADIAQILADAVEWGVEHLDELREMNPKNGWGNAEGALTYLWDVQRSCEAEPESTLEISR